MRKISFKPKEFGYKTEGEMLCNLIANGHTPLSIQKLLIKRGIFVCYSLVVKRIQECSAERGAE